MFEVVQHDERVLRLERVAEDIDSVAVCGHSDAEGVADCRRHSGEITASGEFDQPHAVTKPWCDADGNVESEAGLARQSAARPPLALRFDQRTESAVPADSSAELHPEAEPQWTRRGGAPPPPRPPARGRVRSPTPSQTASSSLGKCQRLRLSTCLVERRNQQAAQRLPVEMFSNLSFQIPDHLIVATQLQIDLDPQLDGLGPLLLQPPSFATGGLRPIVRGGALDPDFRPFAVHGKSPTLSGGWRTKGGDCVVGDHRRARGGSNVKKRLLSLLLVGLTVTACSGSGESSTSAGESATPTTSIETTTEAPVEETSTTLQSATTTSETTTTTEAPVQTTAPPEPQWPPSLAYHEAAYDPVADSILVLGGCGGSQCTPRRSVYRLDLASMVFYAMSRTSFSWSNPIAYDPTSDTIVVLQTAVEDLDSDPVGTWIYDRTTDTWSEAAPADQPRLGLGARMAYDAESGLIVAFGGWTMSQGVIDQTWAYDAETNTWTDMAPATHPPGIDGAAFVYDEQSDLVVLYGSLDSGDASLLWTYDVDTNTWTELDITGGPAEPPFYTRGFYHPPSDRVVIFGGFPPPREPGVEAHNDVWSYDVDSNTWTELAPNSITGLGFHTLTYVPGADRAFAFGGGPIYFDDPSGNRLLAYDPVADTWEEVAPAS